MRNLLNVLGNIIWLVFGGLLAGLAWWLVGVLAYASIVGIPWGRACFVLGTEPLSGAGRRDDHGDLSISAALSGRWHSGLRRCGLGKMMSIPSPNENRR